MTTIETLKNNIQTLNDAISNMQKEIENKKDLLKEEFLKLGRVKGLAEYIRYMGYPRELYSSWGSDPGEYDKFGDIRIKIVYYYGYTDVVGLTDEEFSQLSSLLEDEEYDEGELG